MSEIVATAPFTRVKIDVVHDEDWFDRVPQLIDDRGQPIDLTGCRLSLRVRPVYDHSVLIRELTTENGGIVIEDATAGAVTIRLARSSVQSIPIGTWDQFFVIERPNGFPVYREIWRGPFVVHPARTG